MTNQYGTLEIQKELLAMMKKIHVIMADNHVEYSLCGGTLLGAIRHNGFIPWDDDFDIMMTRSEFNRFVKVYSEIKNKPYSFERDGWVWRIRNYNNLINGVPPTIDIFILDPVTNNKVIYFFQIALLRLLQGLLKEHYYWERYSLFFKICLKATYYLGTLFSHNNIFKAYDKISQWGYKNQSDKLSQFNDQFRILTVKYNADIKNDYCLKAFEDTEFCIITRYDHYLKTQYGDYMTLPPERQRKPMHSEG